MGDLGLSGKMLGGGNGNPLQYFCLENPMDRGAWWAIVQGGCKESDTTEHIHVRSLASEQCLEVSQHIFAK